jgi:hypothetical protein
MTVPGLDPGISPGHPDAVRRRAFQIGITGTRPVMTKRVNSLPAFEEDEVSA